MVIILVFRCFGFLFWFGFFKVRFSYWDDAELELWREQSLMHSSRSLWLCEQVQTLLCHQQVQNLERSDFCHPDTSQGELNFQLSEKEPQWNLFVHVSE